MINNYQYHFLDELLFPELLQFPIRTASLFQPIIFGIRQAYWFGYFTFCPKKKSALITPHHLTNWSWKSMKWYLTFMSIVVRYLVLATIGIYIYKEKSQSSNSMEVMLFITHLAFFGITLPIDYFIYGDVDFLIYVHNSFVILHNNLCCTLNYDLSWSIISLRKVQSVQSFILLPLLIAVPSYFIGATADFPFMRLLNGPNIWTTAVFSSYFAYQTILNSFAALYLCQLFVLYTTVTSAWLKYLRTRWTSQQLQHQRQETVFEYRMLQTFNRTVVDFTKYILPISVGMAEILAITATYILIRSRDVAVWIVILVAWMGSILSLYLVIKLAANFTKQSGAFKEFVFPMNKLEERQLLSCSPMKWRIGEAFTVRRDSSIVILNDVIIQAVIHLILTIKP